jgi:hypothetical protein
MADREAIVVTKDVTSDTIVMGVQMVEATGLPSKFAAPSLTRSYSVTMRAMSSSDSVRVLPLCLSSIDCRLSSIDDNGPGGGEGGLAGTPNRKAIPSDSTPTATRNKAKRLRLRAERLAMDEGNIVAIHRNVTRIA